MTTIINILLIIAGIIAFLFVSRLAYYLFEWIFTLLKVLIEDRCFIRNNIDAEIRKKIENKGTETEKGTIEKQKNVIKFLKIDNPVRYGVRHIGEILAVGIDDKKNILFKTRYGNRIDWENPYYILDLAFRERIIKKVYRQIYHV